MSLLCYLGSRHQACIAFIISKMCIFKCYFISALLPQNTSELRLEPRLAVWRSEMVSSVPSPGMATTTQQRLLEASRSGSTRTGRPDTAAPLPPSCGSHLTREQPGAAGQQGLGLCTLGPKVPCLVPGNAQFSFWGPLTTCLLPWQVLPEACLARPRVFW